MIIKRLTLIGAAISVSRGITSLQADMSAVATLVGAAPGTVPDWHAIHWRKVCGQPLTLADGWHVQHLRWRAHGGDDSLSNLVLLHRDCHRQVHSEGLVVEKAASREGRS